MIAFTLNSIIGNVIVVDQTFAKPMITFILT